MYVKKKRQKTFKKKVFGIIFFLYNNQSPGYFKWSDGWPMQMSKWGMEPDPSNSEGICAAFNTTDGKWWPKPCTEK